MVAASFWLSLDVPSSLPNERSVSCAIKSSWSDSWQRSPLASSDTSTPLVAAGVAVPLLPGDVWVTSGDPERNDILGFEDGEQVGVR